MPTVPIRILSTTAMEDPLEAMDTHRPTSLHLLTINTRLLPTEVTAALNTPNPIPHPLDHPTACTAKLPMVKVPTLLGLTELANPITGDPRECMLIMLTINLLVIIAICPPQNPHRGLHLQVGPKE